VMNDAEVAVPSALPFLLDHLPGGLRAKAVGKRRAARRDLDEICRCNARLSRSPDVGNCGMRPKSLSQAQLRSPTVAPRHAAVELHHPDVN
jgi:hypothetical protein